MVAREREEQSLQEFACPRVEFGFGDTVFLEVVQVQEVATGHLAVQRGRTRGQPVRCVRHREQDQARDPRRMAQRNGPRRGRTEIVTDENRLGDSQGVEQSDETVGDRDGGVVLDRR